MRQNAGRGLQHILVSVDNLRTDTVLTVLVSRDRLQVFAIFELFDGREVRHQVVDLMNALNKGEISECVASHD
jgi:hypothetical protein